VQGEDARDGALARLPADVEQDARGLGGENLPLPTVGVYTDEASELDRVGGELLTSSPPAFPKASDLLN
jgi:hypothetical protein